jgi:hypothetical protein
MITVEPPDVVVAGMHGARHRARCVPTDESKRAAPLQPGDVVIVRSMHSGLAVVERVTAGRPDGCWYILLEFRLISHHAQPSSTQTLLGQSNTRSNAGLQTTLERRRDRVHASSEADAHGIEIDRRDLPNSTS